jgi:hypothetical protein
MPLKGRYVVLKLAAAGGSVADYQPGEAGVHHRKGNAMRTRMGMISVATLIAATSSGVAVAADLPKEGSYDYKACFTRNITRIDFSDAHRAYSYNETATAVSTTPGSMFDGDSVRCVGTVSISNGKRMNLSICEGVAKNGDKRLTRFQYGADGKLLREEVAGTGMYDGMVTTGTVKEVMPSKEIQPGVTTFCNQLTGTYKLK